MNVVEFGKVLKQEIAALFNVEIFKSISRGGGGILENTFWEKAIVFKNHLPLHKPTLPLKRNNIAWLKFVLGEIVNFVVCFCFRIICYLTLVDEGIWRMIGGKYCFIFVQRNLPDGDNSFSKCSLQKHNVCYPCVHDCNLGDGCLILIKDFSTLKPRCIWLERESVGDLSAFCKAKLFVQQEIRLKLDLAREFAFFPNPTFVSGNLRESTSMLPPDRVVLDSPQTCAAAKNFSSLLKVFGVGTRSAPLPLTPPLVAGH